jgi:hypothetical protein
VSLEVEPSTWDDLMARAGCADVYYLRGYSESAATAHEGLAAYLFHAVGAGCVAFPCIVRELRERNVSDVTTVGYGGPLALGVDPPLKQFYALYNSWCRERSIVTTFVRFHPLLESQRYAQEPFHRQKLKGTVSWPLEGDLFAGMHRHHRRLVRKAKSAGVDVVAVPSPARLDEFAALYARTMQRLGAARFYRYPDAYWQQLVLRLDEQLVLFEARRRGELLAGIVCLTGRPWLHYHLGATADAARELGASHLLLYEAACYGQTAGYSQFHLGSGVGESGGSLLEFKQRFTHVPVVEQWLGKAVHDVDRYLELTRAREVTYDGFFPAYRSADVSG